MTTLDTRIATLHASVPEMLRRAQSWVEISSHSRDIAGTNAMGDALALAFGSFGLELRRERGAGCGDHLFWLTQAARQRPPILLIGHHDTVFPADYFEGWRQEGECAYGPGCFDMKGGLALIWGVLYTLAAADLLADLPLVVASVADEEIGSLDSKRHLEEFARGAECALVFESGRPQDQIVTRRRGVGEVRALATGKAAHAGNAHRDGASAIWSLARFIDFAQERTDYARGLTVNVGTVQGGTASNTVPESAEALLDLRFDRVSDAQALLAELSQGASERALSGTNIRLEGGIKRLPMEKTPASDALYREYAAAQRAAGLGSGEHPLVGGGSDANTVAGVGLAVIDGLGPRGGRFHTREEYVELPSFGPKAEALLRFLWARRH
jgi:glutamate carboxypeptidase